MNLNLFTDQFTKKHHESDLQIQLFQKRLHFGLLFFVKNIKPNLCLFLEVEGLFLQENLKQAGNYTANWPLREGSLK